MAFSKILKNQKSPATTIELKVSGVSIPASGTYIIQKEEYTLWATDDVLNEITPLINSGDIVVNNGSRDLSAAEGIRWIEYPDRIEFQLNGTRISDIIKTINIDGPSITAIDNTNGKVTIAGTLSALGSLVPYPFESNGNTSNKWLGYANSAKSSNVIPLIIPQDSSIKGITFSNADNNVDIDIELYKNGILVYTEEIRNKRTYFNVGISEIPTFNQGDRLSVFLRKYSGGTGDNTAQDPTITILGKFINEQAATGGTQNGV